MNRQEGSNAITMAGVEDPMNKAGGSNKLARRIQCNYGKEPKNPMHSGRRIQCNYYPKPGGSNGRIQRTEEEGSNAIAITNQQDPTNRQEGSNEQTEGSNASHYTGRRIECNYHPKPGGSNERARRIQCNYGKQPKDPMNRGRRIQCNCYNKPGGSNEQARRIQ